MTLSLHAHLPALTGRGGTLLSPPARVNHAPSLPFLPPSRQTPEGAQQLAASISRQVSYFSLARGTAANSSSDSLGGPGGAAGGERRGAAEGPPLSPFEQRQAGKGKAAQQPSGPEGEQEGAEGLHEPLLPDAAASP